MHRHIPITLTKAIGLGLLVAGFAAGIWGQSTPARTSDWHAEFVEVGEESGFAYVANNHEQGGNSHASVYVSDYNTDGYPDMLAVGGGEPVLFENTDEGFRRSGALPSVDGTIQAALFFGRDGDGRDDLHLLTRYENPVFLANENGAYERRDAGLADLKLAVPVGATAADYDGDGCLGLFVAQKRGDYWRACQQTKATIGPIDRRNSAKKASDQ